MTETLGFSYHHGWEKNKKMPIPEEELGGKGRILRQAEAKQVWGGRPSIYDR